MWESNWSLIESVRRSRVGGRLSLGRVGCFDAVFLQAVDQDMAGDIAWFAVKFSLCYRLMGRIFDDRHAGQVWDSTFPDVVNSDTVVRVRSKADCSPASKDVWHPCENELREFTISEMEEVDGQR